MGQIYIKAAKEILKINDKLFIQTQNIISGEKGNLKIGVMPCEERYLLPNLLPKIKKIHPQLKIETFTTIPIKVENLLYKNLVNFAILITTDNTDIQHIPLKKFDILLALPLNHKLAKNYTFPSDRKSFPKIDLASLTNEAFVMAKGTYLLNTVQNIANAQNVDLNIELTVSTSDAAISVVRTGYGATFVTNKYIIDNVAYFKIKGEDMQQEVSLAYLKNKQLNLVEQNFLNTIENISFEYTAFEYN